MPTAPVRRTQGRRTQGERTAATRARLLDATFESVLDRGCAATTIAEVQQRAGLARGTLLHHFPTRASLMLGVVEDVAARRLGVLAQPASGGWPEAVAIVRSDLESPVFLVVLELWVAARTDPDLRDALVPVERVVFESVHRAVTDVVGTDDPRVPTLVQFTIDLLTGATMTGLLHHDRAAHELLVRRWVAALGVLLGEADADSWL
ncbi:transcriptional regulator, TetR family [Nocardioides szechwanensis]|uniref:Transcriptional regulator, TetR family n=1 Tax=Nocardioides szechwanensis TaxID=1005944 RepID=A0A1G9XAU5_9ACTN|nr:TetR/AcrR family transcriptional regulator [Nocardioides szechwanensis]SDM93556.1 transcriptional regulator, TetR family [Nocardioides szechwanensis]